MLQLYYKTEIALIESASDLVIRMQRNSKFMRRQTVCRRPTRLAVWRIRNGNRFSADRDSDGSPNDTSAGRATSSCHMSQASWQVPPSG